MEYHYAVFDMRVPSVPPRAAAHEWIKRVSDKFGFGVEAAAHKDFKSPVPDGHAYTLAVILSNSHAVVHTAPEDNWVEVVFACCIDIEMKDLLNEVKEFFSPEDVRTTSFTGSAPRSTA